jgi:hypothetical protein
VSKCEGRFILSGFTGRSDVDAAAAAAVTDVLVAAQLSGRMNITVWYGGYDSHNETSAFELSTGLTRTLQTHSEMITAYVYIECTLEQLDIKHRLASTDCLRHQQTID